MVQVESEVTTASLGPVSSAGKPALGRCCCDDAAGLQFIAAVALSVVFHTEVLEAGARGRALLNRHGIIVIPFAGQSTTIGSLGVAALFGVGARCRSRSWWNRGRRRGRGGRSLVHVESIAATTCLGRVARALEVASRNSGGTAIVQGVATEALPAILDTKPSEGAASCSTLLHCHEIIVEGGTCQSSS